MRVYVTSASAAIRRMLINHGVKRPRVRYAATIADAVASDQAERAAAA